MTDLYAIVPLPPPGPAREALLRDAIAFGGSDELLRKFFECEAVERDLVNQQAQTAEVASRVADIGAHLMDMTEALTARENAAARADAKRKADKARHDAEEAARAEAAQLRDWLDAHPEPGASTGDTHHPGGELHALEPPDKEHLDPEAEGDAGGVPSSYGNVSSSYIKVETEDEPPGIGGATYPEPDPEDLGGRQDPKQVLQPAAVSLW
jgi:hypothetical protein